MTDGPYRVDACWIKGPGVAIAVEVLRNGMTPECEVAAALNAAYRAGGADMEKAERSRLAPPHREAAAALVSWIAHMDAELKAVEIALALAHAERAGAEAMRNAAEQECLSVDNADCPAPTLAEYVRALPLPGEKGSISHAADDKGGQP